MSVKYTWWGYAKNMVRVYPQRVAQYEDIMAAIPSDADAYLKTMYGDYMKLPPKDKQVVRHHTEYIDLNNPYTKYKGIYYCVDKK